MSDETFGCLEFAQRSGGSPSSNSYMAQRLTEWPSTKVSVPISNAVTCLQKGVTAETGELPDWVWPSSCSAACSAAGHWQIQ